MDAANIVIRNARMVNEGQIESSDIWIEGNRIKKIDAQINTGNIKMIEIEAEGLHLFPGIIDDQVHFREPGLIHKGTIATESKAAVAGGITSFMEMPNTVPNALSQHLLEDKFRIAQKSSFANYSFYMGVSNDNYEEVMKTDFRTRPGLKIFLGSSTGNMLVDEPRVLEKIFSTCNGLIAVHCEDEKTIAANLVKAIHQFGEAIPPNYHPTIRSREACYLSSSYAVDLAKKHRTRLHVLHISTAQELDLFEKVTPLLQKKITAEACIHHLWFTHEDYATLGNQIKWNPSIKSLSDREAIRIAVREGQIDVIATDHAPHTLEEKSQPYLSCPSGGPLVQHSLVAMLELYHEGHFSLEQIAQKMAHNVADCFKIESRGYIREGYYADLCLVDLQDSWTVSHENILYKCGWSPFNEKTFRSKVHYTLVNGNIVYHRGVIDPIVRAKELVFSRE